jgi:transposase
MGIELSAAKWKLAFSVGGERIRGSIEIPAGDRQALQLQIERAKTRFELPAEAKSFSCYEAGRDGFWVHRLLEQLGIENVVVDPASIQVNRRRRRAKTDRIDARKLLVDLVRHHRGENDVWKVVRVPTPEQEDGRRLHRELERLKKERSQHQMRIRSLAATQGTRVGALGRFLRTLDRATIWDGSRLPAGLRGEIEREGERLAQVQAQVRLLEKQRDECLSQDSLSLPLQKVVRLASLRSIGVDSAWLLVMELFAWRELQNRKEVGAIAGLTGTPYNTGASEREQGISKAGNALVRQRLIELAWLWVRLQPRSDITLWFQRRYGQASRRIRRVGIVGVARKLLIELWRFVEHDVMPPGAQLKPLTSASR